MADGSSKIEGQYIRGLDIDKTVKGFALVEYIFKNDCNQTAISGDAVRWYSRTATDLTATSPMKVANTAIMALPTKLEQQWTRHTSYTKEYKAEVTISRSDIETADIDVLAGQLLALTRAVTKQVDTRIWAVMNPFIAGEYTALATEPNYVLSSGAWNLGVACNPIKDILAAKRVIWVSGGYNPEGASLYMTPLAYQYLVTWLIDTKGSSIPSFASAKIETGVVMSILGVNIKVSPNVTANYAALVIPNTACTWKTRTAITSAIIPDPLLSSTIRVLEEGEAVLTDPKAVCIISNTE